MIKCWGTGETLRRHYKGGVGEGCPDRSYVEFWRRARETAIGVGKKSSTSSE